MANNNDVRRNQSQPPKISERRRLGRSWVKGAVNAVNIAGWVSFLAFFTFFVYAMPQQDGFFSRFLGSPVRYYWDMAGLRSALITIILSFLLAALGFFLHLLRQRRKNDKFHKASIVLGLVSAVSFIAFVANFSIYL